MEDGISRNDWRNDLAPEGKGVSPNLRRFVLVGVGVLALITPFGREATAAGVFVTYRLGVLGLGAVCFWCGHERRGPDFSARLYVSVASFLGLALLSVWVGPGWRPEARTEWYGLVLVAFFFIGLARFSARQTPAWRRAVLGVVVGCTLFHLALEATGATSVFETFVNRNYLATYLLIGFCASLAIVLFGHAISWRIAAGGAAILLLYGVLGTASRGATLAAAGVVGLALLRLARPRTTLIVGGILIVTVLIGALASPDLIRKFTDRGEVDPYNYDRVGIWTSTLRMVGEEPLMGVGLSGFADRARRFRFPVDNTIGRYMKRINMAHSEYLQFAAETGIPATVLLLGLILGYLASLFSAVGTETEGNSRTTEAAALLVGAGVALHALVDNVWTAPVLVTALTTVALGASPLTAMRRQSIPSSRSGRLYLATATVALFVSSSLIPGMAYAAHNLAIEYSAEGRHEEAASTQRFAVALWPDDATMLTNLGVYHQNLADLGQDPGELDLAGAYFLRATAASPEFLEAREGYANTLLRRLGGDPESDWHIHRQLISAYEHVLEVDPFLPFEARNLAEAYYWTGRKDDAVRLLEHVLRMEPNYVPGHLKLAEWKAAAGELRAAEHLRSSAAEISARYADALHLTEYERLLLGRETGVPGP